MQSILLNKIISILLALNIVTAPSLNSFNIFNETESLVDGNTYETAVDINWIDRVDWAEKEYGPELYQSLEAALDNGVLIDVTQATQNGSYNYIPVTTIEGYAGSKAEAEEKIRQAASIVGQYIGVAYKAFKEDHPEVFWLSGKAHYTTLSTFREGVSCYYKADILFILKSSTFDIRSPEYMDAEKIRETINLRDKLVSSIIQAAPSGSRYQMVEYFNQYLIEYNQYNTSSDLYSLHRDCYECISALRGSSGLDGPTCGAYASAFKVLCDQAGIPCVLVTGYVGEVYHTWNYVQMEDSNWYAVDVTFNDAVSIKATSQAWFLVGSETVIKGSAFGKTHIVSNERLGVEYVGGPELSKEAYKAQ